MSEQIRAQNKKKDEHLHLTGKDSANFTGEDDSTLSDKDVDLPDLVVIFIAVV